MQGLLKVNMQWNARIEKITTQMFKVHEQDYLSFLDHTYHDSQDGICE
jgi:hypothetical protein